MLDFRERRRREALAEPQGERDDPSDRPFEAQDGRVQGELDDLLGPARGAGLEPGAAERDWLAHERDAVESRQDQAADRRRVQHEVDRILREPEDSPGGLERTSQHIERLEQLAERDPLGDRPGFDAEQARKLEDLEIQESPEAFIRRREGGPDPETERKLSRSLRDR